MNMLLRRCLQVGARGASSALQRVLGGCFAPVSALARDVGSRRSWRSSLPWFGFLALAITCASVPLLTACCLPGTGFECNDSCASGVPNGVIGATVDLEGNGMRQPGTLTLTRTAAIPTSAEILLGLHRTSNASVPARRLELEVDTGDGVLMSTEIRSSSTDLVVPNVAQMLDACDGECRLPIVVLTEDLESQYTVRAIPMHAFSGDGECMDVFLTAELEF